MRGESQCKFIFGAIFVPLLFSLLVFIGYGYTVENSDPILTNASVRELINHNDGSSLDQIRLHAKSIIDCVNIKADRGELTLQRYPVSQRLFTQDENGLPDCRVTKIYYWTSTKAQAIKEEIKRYLQVDNLFVICENKNKCKVSLFI